ncbi:6-phosphogluconolactonase [Aequorivita capsosiphonis]|uniref:6-phosphogluconolactonase n=1 Tax=Aequorivita capsosiphonis TaxID=487317 RepID=UPI000417BEBB|nr:6-phosphogluconolactonase [Aequorivita capsosiphonis]
MGLDIYKDLNDLLNALARAICDASEEAINARGQFNFVLSGGNSPRKLYKLLASKKYRNKIDWDKTYFFFGDERFVPRADSQRNSLMAKEALFDPLGISESHVFNVITNGTPEEAAQRYADSIMAHFQDKSIEFDFILLGLGDNAHTASLFPNTTVVKETEATIKSVFVKELDMYRITMTAPLINQARNIAFLVFGKDKSEAVYQVLEDTTSSVKQYPARLINSNDKKVVWYLDTFAASRL